MNGVPIHRIDIALQAKVLANTVSMSYSTVSTHLFVVVEDAVAPKGSGANHMTVG